MLKSNRVLASGTFDELHHKSIDLVNFTDNSRNMNFFRQFNAISKFIFKISKGRQIKISELFKRQIELEAKQEEAVDTQLASASPTKNNRKRVSTHNWNESHSLESEESDVEESFDKVEDEAEHHHTEEESHGNGNAHGNGNGHHKHHGGAQSTPKGTHGQDINIARLSKVSHHLHNNVLGDVPQHNKIHKHGHKKHQHKHGHDHDHGDEDQEEEEECHLSWGTLKFSMRSIRYPVYIFFIFLFYIIGEVLPFLVSLIS